MNQPPSIPGNKSNETMTTQEECGKKTKYKVVTRSPYNLRKQSQDDTYEHSQLEDKLIVGGDM